MKSKLSSFLVIFLCLLSLHTGVCARGRIQGVLDGGFHFEPETKAEPATWQATPALPARYDLRDVNGQCYVDPPEYQNPWNNCWAFADLSAAESNALLDGAENVNLSKRALTWYSYQLQSGKGIPSSQYAGIALSTTNPSLSSVLPFDIGGNTITGFSQMATWNGASTSAEIPYRNDQGLTVDSGFPGITEYSPDGNVVTSVFRYLSRRLSSTKLQYGRY